MERRDLGGTGLVSSQLVLGTMTFGSQVDQAGAVEMVNIALEAGIDHFDTANAYNHGAAEQMLAKALGSRRDEVTIATKVRNRMDDSPDGGGLGAPAIRRAIDDSLRRLDTDRVDLYYLHQPDWDVPIDETLGAMRELVEAGKVRQVGFSNYAAWQVATMLEGAPRHGWPETRIGQQLYNPISRGLEEEYAAFAESYKVATLVYNPLAGGLLTGKHRSRQQPSEGRFAESENYRDRYWSEAQMGAVDLLAAIAENQGMSLIALSLRWLLARPIVDGIILGASNTEQLRANLAAADGPPPDDDACHAMDEVWAQLRGGFPRYNR
jgi:aryl-alcohol dehydrogenase-like predicted oxidoreductase